MKKQERALFVVSLIVLLLVWVMNSNRASAAEYNFFFYDSGNGEKKKDEQQQPSQETDSVKTSEVEPSDEEEVKTKTAAVITPPPVRAPRRFLPLFLLPFLPDDAYFSLGLEHNTYNDKKRGTSDQAPSILIRAKIAPFLALDGSIPIKFYNPGLRIFKVGALTEWEFPGVKAHQGESEYKERWKKGWNSFQHFTSPSIQLSSGWLYNPRHAYDGHLILGFPDEYNWQGILVTRRYRDENSATGMAKSNLYVGGGIRFRFLNHLDLTASLNFLPSRKWSHLFSGGASVVF